MQIKLWQFRFKANSMFFLLLVLVSDVLSIAQSTQPAVAVTLDTPPEFMRDHPDLFGLIARYDDWTMGGGYLYWSQCTDPPTLLDVVKASTANIATKIGYLRRWPVTGGRVVTLSDQAFCRPKIERWAADDSGLYYWANGYIVRRGQDNPLNEVKIVAVPQPGYIAIAFDSTYLYWIANNYIYRTPKNRPSPDDPSYTDVISASGANPFGLIVSTNNNLYWWADNVMYSLPKRCLNDCTRNVLANEAGGGLVDARLVRSRSTGVHPLWGLDQTIRGRECSNTLNYCFLSTLYTAPTIDGHVWLPGQKTTDGKYLYWVENYQDCSGLCQLGSGQLMKWSLVSPSPDTDPFGTPQSIAAAGSGGANYIIDSYQVNVGGGYVFFGTTQGLARILSDALPAQPVIVADKWEINQAIQSLSNDVPLVANKPTYVRIYAYEQSGPRVNGVLPKLDTFGGNGLDQFIGTIYPTNGARSFPSPVENPFDRSNSDNGWLFQLPDNWTNVGKIKLQLTVNGSSNYLIPTFNHKAPICLVAIPVRMNGPAATDRGANYAVAVGMVQRLYPSPGVWTYHQDSDIAKLVIKWGGPFDVIPYPGYDAYSLPENSAAVLASLWQRDQLSDDPDECDDAGARTHYIGIVSPESPTNDPGGGLTNGTGSIDGDQLWFKLPPQGVDPTKLTSTRIATLAHELGHNYGREHVNCGDPDQNEGLDKDYPYDTCMLDQHDQSAFTTYFGFDSWTQQPLAPDKAGDLMSYAQKLDPVKPRWISNYTWSALFNGLKNAATVNAAVATSSRVAAFLQAPALVYMSGIYTQSGGVLNYAWVYPSTNLSDKLRQKWQRALALTTVEAANASAAGTGLHVRLLASNGTVLDDRAVTPLDARGDVETPEKAFAFTLPAPTAQVAQIQLLSGELKLADLHPGAHAPTVTLLQPAGNESIDDKLTLAWRATDADPNDRLLYTVQYSPDNGKTWRALLTSLANPAGSDTTTLNLTQLNGIPGSLPSGALIRVAASDGYNTTFATSLPFTVVNRAPQPYILVPTSKQTYRAGEIVVVQGGADDAEDGGLSGAALSWTLDGAAIGTGISASMEGLSPGQHTLTLTAHDTTGLEKSVSTPLLIAPLAIPTGAAPTLDGDCNDDAYVGAAHVSPQPYADGSRITVLLQRADNYLYVCFNQIKRAGGSSNGSFAVIHVDANHGKDDHPQPDDRGFAVGEDGVPHMWVGVGSDWSAVIPNGLVGRVSTNGASWNAEVQIDVNTFGGWNHVVGLDVQHAGVNAAGDDYYWPYRARWLTPSSWATTVLGDLPQLTNLQPVSSTVGGGNLTLTINGANFANGATAQWNSAVLSTTVLSTTQLQAQIPATALSTSTVLTITVVNPGIAGTPSNPLDFVVRNPLPTIAKVSLNSGLLTVTGSDFVNKAQVIWNGEERPATFMNGSELQASVEVSTLPVTQTLFVAVFNPGPGGGVSNLVPVTIPGVTPAPPDPNLNKHIYLPVVTR